MGLITEQSAPDAAKTYILDEIKSAVSHLEGALISSFTRFWSDSSTATPQQICDAFGTDAALLVQVFAASRDLVNMISPGTISLLGPSTLILNQDGSVTVGAPS